MCDKVCDETINKIPTSTHKRMLYMNKQSVTVSTIIIIF